MNQVGKKKGKRREIKKRDKDRREQRDDERFGVARKNEKEKKSVESEAEGTKR